MSKFYTIHESMIPTDLIEVSIYNIENIFKSFCRFHFNDRYFLGFINNMVAIEWE